MIVISKTFKNYKHLVEIILLKVNNLNSIHEGAWSHIKTILKSICFTVRYAEGSCVPKIVLALM